MASSWDKHVLALHSIFAGRPDRHCLLWVNPAQSDPFEGDLLVEERKFRVPIKHPRFDLRYAPYLVRLDLSRSKDSDVLARSVELACHAWKAAQVDNMRRAWTEFRKSESSGNAIKDVRAALLVMLIEGVNFAKMMDACKQKNDAKSWLGLAASSMTITSGLFDVASTAIKGMTKDINGDFDKGASLWSYQKLKLFGGLLSAGSAMIGATIDYEDFEKNSARGEDNIARLYLLKTIAGGVSSLMSVAGSLTYSTPYIRGLIKGIFLDTAAQIIKKEITLVAGRILLMAVGTGASLLVFTLQVLIWIFSDDELQSWCSLCAFGKERNTKAAFLSSAAQTTALNRALVSIYLAPAAAPSNNRFWESAPKPTIEEMKMYD
ncbi:hypothetical protein [Herbaspirillum rubrisubalbicans]|uniref:hypothetical protein n=1 Tax=Herbaspirillum rubrisubalbicans TaxID=80842 RepID=UPI000370B855|nr:hypothetical protein [Herbaspirillum rubrisubalbicans]